MATAKKEKEKETVKRAEEAEEIEESKEIGEDAGSEAERLHNDNPEDWRRNSRLFWKEMPRNSPITLKSFF